MPTERDKEVLNLIVNPFLPNSVNFINLKEEEFTEEWFLKLENFEECQKLEIEGITLAEKKSYKEAILKFTEAIKICSQNPSPYNNRAQTYRCMKKIEDAIIDLNKVIKLSENIEPEKKYLKVRDKILSQAYVQRALIAQLNNSNEDAKIYYEKAANKGSSFAKMQLVALNPYAALCSNVLHQAIQKLQTVEN